MMGAHLSSRAQKESLRVASHVCSCDPPLLLMNNFDDPQRCFNGGGDHVIRVAIRYRGSFNLSHLVEDANAHTMGIANFAFSFPTAQHQIS